MAKHETSTTYRWPASEASMVDVVEFVRQKNGSTVAYLHAKEDPSLHAQRLEVRAAIRAKGWGTLSDFREGQYVLRVNGLKDESGLVELLANSGYTRGTPTLQTQRAEKDAPKGVFGSLRANSLRASGIFYSLGNLVYLTSGLLRSKEKGSTDWGQIQSALTWGAGDLLVAGIGGKDDGRQLGSLLTKLKHHYEREGIDIPVTAAIHSETQNHNQGLKNKISNFLRDYLNQIKCITESIAAIGYYKAGKTQGNVHKQATAVTFGLGFLVSALVPEKKINQEKYETAGTLGRLWMRIQSNPLSVGGLSGYSNTILTSVSAYKEGQRFNDPVNHPPIIDKVTGTPIAPSKYYKLDYLAPGVMFFGNGLYAMSKKTTGGDIRTEAMIGDIYSVASQILNKLPPEKREGAIESTIAFLAENPAIPGSRVEVSAKLRETMERQRQNPWFEPVAAHQKRESAVTPADLARAPVTPVEHAATLEQSAAPASTITAGVEHLSKGLTSSIIDHDQLAASGR